MGWALWGAFRWTSTWKTSRQPADTDLSINCDIPTKKEIRRAINLLKNGKAAGLDEIPAEAIKVDTETSVSIPFNLVKKIWEEESIPEEWKEGILIKLPQKGDKRGYSNYRGIMILSVPGKVLYRIRLERISKSYAVDPKLRDQQAEFRSNILCADQIARLRIIIEQSLEWSPHFMSTPLTMRLIVWTERLFGRYWGSMEHPRYWSP